MALRDTLNNNSTIVTIGAVLVIVVAIGFLIHSHGADDSGLTSAKVMFFTSDDGKTLFKDDANKVPPFKTSDGKEAVQAVIYTCDHGKSQFVAYLSRYTPEAQKQALDLLAKQASGADVPGIGGVITSIQQGQEVKRPGDANWVRATLPQEWSRVTTPTCPTGVPGAPERVIP